MQPLTETEAVTMMDEIQVTYEKILTDLTQHDPDLTNDTVKEMVTTVNTVIGIPSNQFDTPKDPIALECQAEKLLEFALDENLPESLIGSDLFSGTIFRPEKVLEFINQKGAHLGDRFDLSVCLEKQTATMMLFVYMGTFIMDGWNNISAEMRDGRLQFLSMVTASFYQGFDGEGKQFLAKIVPEYKPLNVYFNYLTQEVTLNEF